MIEPGFKPGRAHVLTHCMTLPLNIIGLVFLNILELSGCRQISHFALKFILKLFTGVLVRALQGNRTNRICVCVCVYVYERQREKKRERQTAYIERD